MTDRDQGIFDTKMMVFLWFKEGASDAAKSWDPVRRRHLRKIAQKARREFEAGKAVLPRGKLINRPVVTKLWVNGRASVDRDEWTEVRAHCERCYDDKEEPLRCRPQGFNDRGAAAIGVWPVRGVGLRSRLMGFFGHEERCCGTRPTDPPIAW